MQVRVSKGADYRYIPRQRFAALPYYYYYIKRNKTATEDKPSSHALSAKRVDLKDTV